MYLLDTNHCSRAILRDEAIISNLKIREKERVSTCVIVRGELIDMAERSQRRKANLTLVENFLKGIYIYDLDTITATLYGQLKASIFRQFAPKQKNKRRKTKIVNLGFDENDVYPIFLSALLIVRSLLGDTRFFLWQVSSSMHRID